MLHLDSSRLWLDKASYQGLSQENADCKFFGCPMFQGRPEYTQNFNHKQLFTH